MVLGNLIKMTNSLYLNPGASNLFESENRPNLNLIEFKGESILWLELIRCKLSGTKQSCNYDEVSSNPELNGQ